MPASAQDAWTSKQIRLIVPFTPAGVAYTSGRAIADALCYLLGRQVIVDNKPGTSGKIGTALAKAAPADGYTLVLGSRAPCDQPARGGLSFGTSGTGGTPHIAGELLKCAPART